LLLLVNEEAGSAIEITLFVSEEDRSNTEEDGGVLERKLELLADRLDEPPRIEAHELRIISLAATNVCRRDCLCNARTACNASSFIHPGFIAPAGIAGDPVTDHGLEGCVKVDRKTLSYLISQGYVSACAAAQVRWQVRPPR
jgi:hypothetical protein